MQASRAALEYGRSARQLETLRLSVEVLHNEYMYLGILLPNLHALTILAQNIMTEHIKILKESLKSALEIESHPLTAIKTLTTRLSIFLESLNPEKDVISISENDKTAFKPIATYVPKSFPIDPCLFLFGVSLEKLESRTKCRIPSFISKGTEYLHDIFRNDQPNKSSHLDVWISQSNNLPAIHSLRAVLNGSVTVTRQILRKYPPEIIVGAMKLYLLELPISVCCYDIYDSLKILYLSKADDSTENRLSSVRNILATLPSSHFYTLACLVQYWSGIISHLERNDPRISELSTVLGQYLLRPMVNSFVILFIIA